MTRPSVLVLMAAYNGARYIDEQIDSILAQQDVDIKIQVRVDPSTDGTSDRIRLRTHADSRVLLCTTDADAAPMGAAANFFRLIRAVELPGDVTHVAFADQDDVWHPNKLARAAEVMASQHAHGYSSDVDEWDSATGTKRPLIKSQPQTPIDHLFSSAGPGCTYVLDRETFMAFQTAVRSSFDLALRIDYHDWLIYAWVRQHGRRWIIDPDRTMAYRQHGENQIGANSGTQAAVRRLRDLRNGWYSEQVLLIAQFVGADRLPMINAIGRKNARALRESIKHTRQLRRRPMDAAIAAVALTAGRRTNPPHKDSLPPMDPKLIAFYLPQYHQIPENDSWWGEGFTEWVNVRRARPLFTGHDHPRVPTDLGYYDLTSDEIRHRQTELAREYGVDAFCMYFYWFEGRRLLERPVDAWRNDTSLLPYCVCWANEPWSRRWDGRNHDVLMPQSYPDEYESALFKDLLPHLQARHYLRQNGRPVLLVHRADLIPNSQEFSRRLREMAISAGLPGLYLVASETITEIDPRALGFDAVAEFPPVGSNTLRNALVPAPPRLDPDFTGRLLSYPRIAARFMQRKAPSFTRHRGVMPRWDNSARRGTSATVYVGDTPGVYQEWLASAMADERAQRGDDGLVFINAWNEWAEAAYLEPDQATGRTYLEATRAARVESRVALPEGANRSRHAYARNLGLLTAGSALSVWRKARNRVGM